MERMILSLLVLVCLGCGDITTPQPSREPVVNLMMQGPVEKPKAPEESEAPAPQITPQPDPYEDYESWCEDIFKQTCECPTKDAIVCDEPKEPCPADRTGKSQVCVRPQWARREGSHVYMCDPGWLNRKQQQRQRESQRVIVDAVCEWPSWAGDLSEWGKANKYGDDPSKLCWHLKGGSKELKECRGGHFCQPDKLSRFLALVAARESTWNNNTSHELNLDVEANRASYSKAKRKGWYKDNEHFYDHARWARGYGWYGQNAALNVFRWDSKAPPEILCRQVESTEIYLRNARRSFKKLWAIYGDDKERTYKLDTGEEVKVKGVTWYDVHRAIAGGKLHPEEVITTQRWSKKKQRWLKVGFVSRARSKYIDLDPFETVMWEMLGEEIPHDRQNEIADDIRHRTIRHFDAQAANSGGYTGAVAADG